MKIPFYIFSIYMVLVSLYPCCLLEDCDEDNQISMELREAHDEEEENCGVNCEGCCGSISFSMENNSFSLVSLNSPKVYTNFLQPFVPEVHIEFWRPPQLG